MNTMFINSKNSETSDPHRLLLNLTDKMDLRRKDEYIPLSNLSIFYTWKSHRLRIISLKYQLQHRMKNLNYLMDHILYQIFNIMLNICLQRTGKK